MNAPAHDNPNKPQTEASDRKPGLLERSISDLMRRVYRHAASTVDMVERAIDALWTLDRDAAAALRRDDDRIDAEEMAIQHECYRILALNNPVARDFRAITYVLRVNHNVERVADHACSLAKIINAIEDEHAPQWPTALVDLGQRVPILCHDLLRTMLDGDVDAARDIIANDKTIDTLNHRLFGETVELMHREPSSSANGLLIFRAGRELERVGDLMTDIAREIVYLETGTVIRHQRLSDPQ
ncbi:MAG: phosphate signaling complex protein PhoU [Planctomycetota bacterium]